MGPPGHLAIGFAAKPLAPKAPLLVLLLASEALDMLNFGFETIGLEALGVSQISLTQGLQMITPASVQWSHGLFMSMVWSLLFAAVAYLVYRDRRTGVVIGLVVFSHWVLDFIVHPADLPLLFSGSPLLGLGLWTSGTGFIISIILEIALLAGGVAVYLDARKRIPARAKI